MDPGIVLLHKQTGETVVMEEEVRFLKESELPLSLPWMEHSAYHIERILEAQNKPSSTCVM